jgi:hypothetical protein
MSVAGTVAVSVVLLPVVARLTPFQLMAEVDAKPLPFTVSVKDGSPAVAFFGEMEERVGAKLSPPLDPEFPEFPELPEAPEFPDPPDEQLIREMRTAEVITDRLKREILVGAFTGRSLPKGVNLALYQRWIVPYSAL